MYGLPVTVHVPDTLPLVSVDALATSVSSVPIATAIPSLSILFMLFSCFPMLLSNSVGCFFVFVYCSWFTAVTVVGIKRP